MKSVRKLTDKIKKVRRLKVNAIKHFLYYVLCAFLIAYNANVYGDVATNELL